MFRTVFLVDKVRFGVLSASDPPFQGVDVFLRVNSRKKFKRVGSKHHVVGPDNPTIFVNPESGGNVVNVIPLGQPVTGVDQAWMVGFSLFNIGTWIVKIAFQSNRDQGKILVLEFLVDILPDWQVISTASPGRPDQ